MSEPRTVKLFCPSLSKLVQFVAWDEQRLDLGSIARAFGLDPSTVKLNGHFISRGVDLVSSSVTWRSLLKFFSAKGLAIGKDDKDPLIVDGRVCKVGSKRSHDSQDALDGIPDKVPSEHSITSQKGSSEDINLVKNKKPRDSSLGCEEGDNQFASNCNCNGNGIGFKRRHLLEDDGLLKKSRISEPSNDSPGKGSNHTCIIPQFKCSYSTENVKRPREDEVGDFSDDNRSGIDRSLHRISAIRNRKLQIIGLTCRVGRAVSGSAEILQDLVEGGGSVLVIGSPGVGKTTLIREMARMLADEHKKRVVIVDTSNEIGGDGDVPHAGIGRARRMQVPNVNMQHSVMIEAVENHMPETIIIDEIGTELEALAASTIAQRGVQLVGTAHGMTIENIIKNPSLQILVGGVESVTLGDEEARKRKVQKTILERKGPPTFTSAVELISRTEYHVHHKLDATVDAILAGKSPLFEVRQMDADNHDLLMSTPIFRENYQEESELTSNEDKSSEVESDEEDEDYSPKQYKKWSTKRSVSKRRLPVCVYTYKILEADLLQVAKVMRLEGEIDVTDNIGAANAILASSSELKQNPWIRGVAIFHQLPVFVIKSNTMAQMVKAVRMILGLESFSSMSEQSLKGSFDIEIEDDAPKRKPTLEEIDAGEQEEFFSPRFK